MSVGRSFQLEWGLCLVAPTCRDQEALRQPHGGAMSLPSYEPGFDYDQLPAECRGELRALGENLRSGLTRIREDFIQVGRDLIEAQKLLQERGELWLPWLKAELGMPERRAREFMAIGRRFGVESAGLAGFTFTTLLELAAPSTPAEIVEQVVEMQQTGENVTATAVKAMKAAWKEEKGQLGKEIAKQKSKRRDAESTAKSIREQLDQDREEKAELRRRNWALLYALDEEAKRRLEDRDQWLEVGMTWWDCGSEEWRETFLERIGARTS